MTKVEEFKSEKQRFKHLMTERPNSDIQVAFDLDGVLASNNNGDYENAAPLKEGIEAINKVYDLGYDVTIYTARFGKRSPGFQYQMGYELTLTWLRKNGVKFHRLIMGKPAYDIVADDKAVRIDINNPVAGWQEFWRQLDLVHNKNQYGQ